MNTITAALIAKTLVADRSHRYERAATNRRLVQRAFRNAGFGAHDRRDGGRDPDHAAAAEAAHTAQLATELATPANHLVAVTAASGTTRSTSTASSPMASLPVDRVA